MIGKIGICWAEALSWERVARAARRVWGGTTYLVPPLIRPSVRTGAPSPRGRHLPDKSQFFAQPTGRGAQWRLYVTPRFVTNCLQAQPGRGAQRQLYLVPNVRNALAVGHADKSQFAALLGSLPGRQGKTACFNPIILYRLSWTSGYICAILKTKTVERGLRLCQK